MVKLNLPPETRSLVAYVGGPMAVAQAISVLALPHIQGWYNRLKKPEWTPPKIVFGPMWAVMYAAQGYAGWRVLHQQGVRGLAAKLWGAQLALNFAWAPVLQCAQAEGRPRRHPGTGPGHRPHGAAVQQARPQGRGASAALPGLDHLCHRAELQDHDRQPAAGQPRGAAARGGGQRRRRSCGRQGGAGCVVRPEGKGSSLMGGFGDGKGNRQTEAGAAAAGGAPGSGSLQVDIASTCRGAAGRAV